MLLKQEDIKKFFSKQPHNEAGFSLLIVLLLITAIGSVFSSLLWYQRNEVVQQRAFAAGWHIVQISKAARIYVRDRSTSGLPADAGFEAINLAGNSIEVSINDLIAAGHLPAGFPATNPLGQQTRVFAATFPVSGGVNAVSTAYVVTERVGALSKGALYNDASVVAALMLGAREEGLSASSPLLAEGSNFSEDCNGTPAVVIWDTGCLNEAEAAIVTGGAVTFQEGQVMVPAWRAFNHDLRAIMRFPQPENVTANVMATNLHFWDSATSAPDVYDGSGGLVTNNRTNLIGLQDMTIVSLVATDQGAISGPDETFTEDLGASGGNGIVVQQKVLNVANGLTIGNILTLDNNGADLPNVLHMPETGSNILTVGDNMTANDVVVESLVGSTGLLDVQGNIIVEEVTASNITSFNTATIEKLGEPGRAGSLAVIASNPATDFFAVDTINNVTRTQLFSPSQQIRVLSDITFNPGGSMTVTGSAPFGSTSLRAGTINDTAVTVTGSTTMDSGVQFNGNTTIKDVFVDTCFFDCPTEVP